MRKNDLILILILLLAAGGWYAFHELHKDTGNTVLVKVEGEVYGRYPLEQDQELDIQGKDGGVNHMVIKDGMVSITEADCPDELCVKEGTINQVGESIICIPHQVVIEITKESSEEKEVDVIAK